VEYPDRVLNSSTPIPGSASTTTGEPATRYSLVAARDGSTTLRDTRLNETFHPELGMAEEIRLLLDQAEVAPPAAPKWVVWDLGLGAGGMAAGILRHTASWPCEVDVHSFDIRWDAFDLARESSMPHLSGLPCDPLRRDGKTEWLEKGMTRRWTMHPGDLPDLMENTPPGSLPLPDLAVVDLHSPESQPELWTLAFWQNVHRHSTGKPGLFLFHTRSTSVRATLLLAGFYVGKGRALGKKEETTLACMEPGILSRPLDTAWLDTLARSTQGQPLISPPFTRQIIEPVYLAAVRQHPQFHA